MSLILKESLIDLISLKNNFLWSSEVEVDLANGSFGSGTDRVKFGSGQLRVKSIRVGYGFGSGEVRVRF